MPQVLKVSEAGPTGTPHVDERQPSPQSHNTQSWPRPFDAPTSSQKFWRIRGEVQSPAAYLQFRLNMAVVCKTALFTLKATSWSVGQPPFRAGPGCALEWMIWASRVPLAPDGSRAPIRRSVRSPAGTLVAQRDDRWSRPSREIRRYARRCGRRAAWSAGTEWLVCRVTGLPIWRAYRTRTKPRLGARSCKSPGAVVLELLAAARLNRSVRAWMRCAGGGGWRASPSPENVSEPYDCLPAAASFVLRDVRVYRLGPVHDRRGRELQAVFGD